MNKNKKLVHNSMFNALANKAAANCWRALHPWAPADLNNKEILERIARRNRNLDECGHGYAESTFRKPTACKSGFFKVLLTVYDYPGESSKELASWAGVKSLALTLRRLEGAKFIKRKLEDCIIRWYITKLGDKYLDAVFYEFGNKLFVEL